MLCLSRSPASAPRLRCGRAPTRAASGPGRAARCPSPACARERPALALQRAYGAPAPGRRGPGGGCVPPRLAAAASESGNSALAAGPVDAPGPARVSAAGGRVDPSPSRRAAIRCYRAGWAADAAAMARDAWVAQVGGTQARGRMLAAIWMSISQLPVCLAHRAAFVRDSWQIGGGCGSYRASQGRLRTQADGSADSESTRSGPRSGSAPLDREVSAPRGPAGSGDSPRSARARRPAVHRLTRPQQGLDGCTGKAAGAGAEAGGGLRGGGSVRGAPNRLVVLDCTLAVRGALQGPTRGPTGPPARPSRWAWSRQDPGSSPPLGVSAGARSWGLAAASLAAAQDSDKGQLHCPISLREAPA